ncbi:zinc finger protein OZF-like [Daktulosphaira vitifoliae]|uniref:zinc finger protein OZF-like n=1 Tax=Daktulosphaira vitifoliae TaxID=58002 RepID=UPI0021AAFF10|nr:zinc finger protein OZF-like [Daktulosphaira vitifoliae]XP_050523136.1 zinc finger protein OZF-like [Daktulosphaira vitifoliae]XP_050523137.1 zinc finger protein OZF-like [Daktulosphaira vitifoliae]XP_050523138.1 zinc finger protein OZF-like [Daktulosphaira vitifoliae]
MNKDCQIKQEICVITHDNDYIDVPLSKSAVNYNSLFVKREEKKEDDKIIKCYFETLKVEGDLLLDYKKINEVNSKPLFVCHHCQEKFIFKKEIIRHLTNFHNNNSNSDFNSGKKNSPQSQVECSDCKNTFNSKFILNRHRRIHTGLKPYGCVTCLKKFSRSDILRKHQEQEHNYKKYYKCQFCSKSFCRKANLLKHIKVMHIKGSAIVCQVCYTHFTKKANLTRHMNNVHSNAEQKGKPTRCFECNECSKSFMSNADLKRHKYVHSGMKPFKCNICLKSFSQRISLTIHLRIHTGEKVFKCGKCLLLFSRSDRLRAHAVSNVCQMWVDEKSIL